MTDISNLYYIIEIIIVLIDNYCEGLSSMKVVVVLKVRKFEKTIDNVRQIMMKVERFLEKYDRSCHI